MTNVAEAEALVLQNMPTWEAEEIGLPAAVGRTLANDVHAERDQPPFDRVTMDGIAIAHGDWLAGIRRYRIVGVQAAGKPPLALSAGGECVRIMTGAMRPDGADSIVPIERVRIEADYAAVEAGADVRPRQFIHPRGSDRYEHEQILGAGTLIGPAEVAILASAGVARPRVASLPRIAVVSTGDELVGLEDPVAPYQIRSSNDFAIEASLVRHRLAVVTRKHLDDDEAELLEEIDALHAGHDALILSGGVSMGEFDFVPSVLERLGATVVFHRIEQRPGRPMWFGTTRDGKPVFALPGNPVSTLVCLTRYVLPALRHAAGLAARAEERVALAAPVEGPEKMSYFVPVELSSSDTAKLLAEPRQTNTSGDFVTLGGTDGFVELPPGGAHPAGTIGRLFRW